ncbi:hypothetical protein SAMN05444162_0042 [Paenibacillaceae bacterium GAS479]|nr:hypothetical protein SAMN05444162_0042 [Paenibacillaceae bacterium GAS479]
MLRNNLLSLAAHAIVLIFSGLLSSMAGRQPLWIYFVVLLSFIGYALFGYLYMRPMRSSLHNFVSVSLASLIGLLIGVYCWNFPSLMGFNWMIFLFYNLYAFLLADFVPFSPEPKLTIWFFIVPSLFLWIGMGLRRS